MKKRVNVILILVSLIFLIHFISAAVPITVKTVKGHDVLLTIYEGESTQVYESKKFPMIETNSIEYSYTGIAKSLRIIVFVSVYGQKVVSEVFEDLPTNEEIILEVYPDNYVPAQDTEVTQNDPVVAQNNTELILDENNTVEVDPSLILDEEEKPTSDINLEKVEGTGLVTGQNKSSFNVPNLAFYIIGGVFIVAILVFFIMKTASKRKNIYDDYDDSHKEKIKVRKLSQIHQETKNTEGIRKEIAEAEEKLRRAQEQLNIVKNQDKIKEAEAKLERDRHELDELRRGRR